MGGGFRHRVSNKAAIKIKSGSACESVPTKSRHRTAAMAARNASFGGASMLPVEDRPENPAADDMLSALPIENMAIGSSKSMVSEGGISRISEFTSCTNPAFDSVTRIWKSGSSIQAEVVSVLAAIAEIIKERDGKESDVAYCAALMTALEGATNGNPKRTAAIAYLLHLIVRKVPKEVLQSQFTRFVEILHSKMIDNIDNTEGSALKNLISVLGIILRAQPASVWGSSNTKKTLVSVSALAAHDKPWVRTMARRVIRAILTDPVTATDNGLHPASGAIGQHILYHIESFLSGSKRDNTNVVRYLCLLEGIMHKMPANLFKKMAEAMLKCFAVADAMVKCSSLQCLHRALQRQPCDSALPTETNSLLVVALRQLGTTAIADVSVTAYWMQALSEAHVCLTAKDSKKSIQHAYQSLPLFVRVFETGNEQLAQIAYQALTRIIENCVKDDNECGKFLLGQLHSVMNMKSAVVWKFILRTQMKLYEVCGEGIQGEEFAKVLEDLAKLRQSNECFCKTELDFSIGAAVRHVGVGHVMNVLSLEVDPDAAVLSTDFTRSWLLPILRVNIHNAPIALFTTHFLPIAMKIHRRLGSLQAPVQRLYTTFQAQLWELLPSFCETPSDLETSFPDIAPILGAALQERTDLRMTVLNAIRRALRFCLQPDAPAERIEVLSRYAKNYMPIFFNMYTASVIDGGYDDKGVRLSVLEAIRLYAEATPEDLIERFVDSAITKSKENSDGSAAASQKQARVLDILCALTRVSGKTEIAKILDAILVWFDSKDVNGLQKKSYRILEEVILRRASPEIEELMKERWEYVQKAILRPIKEVTFPARAPYCSCVHMLMDNLDSLTEVTEFAEKVIGNIILLLDKDNNVHTRQNASKCLQFICSKLLELADDPSTDSPSAVLEVVISKIFEMTTLNTNQKTTSDIPLHVARSCLVAANIIAQKQIKLLNTVSTSRILSFGCSWIAEGRAPVRILAIRLMRVLCQKIPEVVLQQFRDQILNTVLEGQLTCDVTLKVRKANRLMLEVLVEKFGVNVLEKYTKKPDWLKQMRNIDKIRKRKLRKEAGEAMDTGEDDAMSAISGSNVSGRTAGADTILELLEDSDAENDSDSEEQLMRKSRVGSVWLKNEADGDVPMDLLDSSKMIDQITTTNPAILEKRKKKALERKEKNEAGFSFTKDGRLVIVEEEPDEVKRSGRKRNGLDDLDYEDAGPTQANKRQKEDSDLESDLISDDEDAGDKKTHVSKGPSFGGQGIYRDTSGKSQVGTSSAASNVGAKKHKKGQKRPEKKQQNVQPYAYVPLRNKTAKQDVRQILKAKRKSGKGGMKKVTF